MAGVVEGGGLEWRTREGVSFFGAAEAIGMSDSGTVISARGGIHVAFRARAAFPYLARPGPFRHVRSTSALRR